jgi:hypothetical protein
MYLNNYPQVKNYVAIADMNLVEDLTQNMLYKQDVIMTKEYANEHINLLKKKKRSMRRKILTG